MKSKLKVAIVALFGVTLVCLIAILAINVYMAATYYVMPRNAETMYSVSAVYSPTDGLCVVFPYNYDYGFLLPIQYRIRLKLNDEFIPRSSIRIRTTVETLNFRYYMACADTHVPSGSTNTVTTIFYSSPPHANVNTQDLYRP